MQANVAPFAEYFPVPIDDVEFLFQVGNTFAGAQEQNAARAQTEMKQRQNLSLRGRVQVNQHIATSNQIEFRERRILGEIVRGEDHQLAQVLIDDELVA